jgi:hypothetical protein
MKDRILNRVSFTFVIRGFATPSVGINPFSLSIAGKQASNLAIIFRVIFFRVFRVFRGSPVQ